MLTKGFCVLIFLVILPAMIASAAMPAGATETGANRVAPTAVNPVNNAPVAQNQSVTTNEDTAKAITLGGTDPDRDTLTYTIVSSPSHGTLTGTGAFRTYKPALNYNGTDSFTFKVNDGKVDSNIATISITVTPVNDPPVAQSQSVTTNEDTAKTIPLVATDVEGDVLTYAIVAQPLRGRLSGTPPDVTYTPNANYTGGDSFTFKAYDGKLWSSVARVSITVTPVNDPPVAQSQSVTTNEDTAKTITLVATDVEGDPLTYTIVSSPSHGTLTGTGTFRTYKPALNYNGTDSFTFKVNDGKVDSNIATISITVTPVNDPPVAQSQSVTTNEDTAKTIPLVATDVEGDVLTYAIVAQPLRGRLSGTPPDVTYTPNANYTGGDSFTFKAYDGKLWSSVARVSITVTVNHPPVARDQSVNTNEDTPKAITLAATDLDADPLTYSIVASPVHGLLSGTPPNVTYTPAANYNGPDSLTFKANDGKGDSNIATVSITVTPIIGGNIITTTAGNGEVSYGGDGGPAVEAKLAYPRGVATDNFGNLYIADEKNSRIRKVDTNGIIATVAGDYNVGCWNEGNATSVSLGYPKGVAIDIWGNLYIADPICHRIRKVDTNGILTTVAGSIPPCCQSDYFSGRFGGDGGPATGPEAALNLPEDVAVDALGNLYIADRYNHRIRKVDTNGIITTLAGNGISGYGGDGGPASQAGLRYPSGVAIDGSGNLYIGDGGNQRVRKVDTNGIITTVAGNGSWGYSGDGGLATEAELYGPSGVTIDASGNLYIADRGNHCIRKIDPDGIITTVAGNRIGGYSGDGGPATEAQFNYPEKVSVDALGNLYIGDTYNYRIRKVSSISPPMKGIVTGKVTDSSTEQPLSDVRVIITDSRHSYTTKTNLDGLYMVARLTPGSFKAIFVKSGYTEQVISGTLISDQNQTLIIELTLLPPCGDIITTIAGSGARGYGGDGGAAINAKLYDPSGVALGSSGNVYIADTSNHRIRKVDSNGIMTTIAGTGATNFWDEGYFWGDGGPATQAVLNFPHGLAVDNSGNLYIADQFNHRIRKVGASGIITTVAGNGIEGYSGDGGLATTAQLQYPNAVAVDGSANLYIADRYNHRIRKVGVSGIITTVAGNGNWGYRGDGGPATQAQLNSPTSVAVDFRGNLYIVDQDNHRIRKVDGAGTITTVAGNGANGYSGDEGLATKAKLSFPMGMAVDPSGNLYIADRYNHRIRKVDVNGIITTVAGDGSGQYGGDGGPPDQAQLSLPQGVVVDSLGNLFIADTYNDRIRLVMPKNGTITGKLTDSSTSSPLSDVTVNIKDSFRTLAARTDSDGVYSISGLNPGSFSATFVKTGYAIETVTGTLMTNETRTLDIQLVFIHPLNIAITSPQDGETLNSSPILMTGNVNNNATVSVNGIQASVSQNAFSVSIPLTQGSNTITASAADQYGQTASHTINVTLIKKGELTGTVTDGSTGLPLSSATVSVTDSLNVMKTGLTDQDGKYTITDISSGAFNGSITKGGYSTFNFSGTITLGQTIVTNGVLNPILPIISSIVVSGVTKDSATITWTTDQATDSLVDYGTAQSYGNWAKDPILTTTHSVTITNLTPGTTYHFKLTSTNTFGLSSSSGDRTFETQRPLLTLVITSPANGAIINRSDIMIKGTVINAKGNETGVTVNGKIAMVFGTEFVVNHIPLEGGPNTLAAIATDTEGTTATTSVVVSAAQAEEYINLTASTESGISPFEVVLTIDSSLDLTDATLTNIGPGEVEFLSRTVSEYRVKLTAEGIYYFTVTLNAPSEGVYTDTIGIAVLSEAELDTLLRSKWEGMKLALANHDAERALLHFSSENRETYRDQFTGLAALLSEIVNELSNAEINMISAEDNSAEYELLVEREGKRFSFHLQFVKDADGVWRIGRF